MCKFEHSQQAKASKKAIWTLWTHPNTWPHWDNEIREATLQSPFTIGAKGTIQLKSNTRIPFIIASYNNYKNLTLKANFFLCTIMFYHELHEHAGYLKITHRVQLFGPLKYFYWFFMRKQMQKAIPYAMENLIKQAEQKHTL